MFGFILMLFFQFSSFGNIRPNSLPPSYATNTVVSDSQMLTMTVIDYLNFYQNNYSNVMDIFLVNTDSSGWYNVDFGQTEVFLDLLSSSGKVSDKYIHGWRQYFKSWEAHYKQHPQNEGPPEGFDFDLVIGTQEPELILNAIDKLKFKINFIHGNRAELDMYGAWQYKIKLDKSYGAWKIDSMEIVK